MFFLQKSHALEIVLVQFWTDDNSLIELVTATVFNYAG